MRPHDKRANDDKKGMNGNTNGKNDKSIIYFCKLHIGIFSFYFKSDLSKSNRRSDF